jgi:hypothetical protein
MNKMSFLFSDLTSRKEDLLRWISATCEVLKTSKGSQTSTGLVVAILLNLIIPFTAFALDFDIQGQLSAWTTETNIDDDWHNQTGVRYIPQLTLEQPAGDANFFDLEISGNGYWLYDTETEDDDSDAELYRLKLRFATPQTDTRIGLQKINFGPAQLLRSLQWFDTLDPRDPQKFTDGVWGLRFRYYAMNNANLWLWALYGNDERKGMEILPSVEDEGEFGGRFQYPVFGGELAATFHTRNVDFPSSLISYPVFPSFSFQRSGVGTQNADAPASSRCMTQSVEPWVIMQGKAPKEIQRGNQLVSDYRENRYALDGRWDVEIGLWFEAVLQENNIENIPLEAAKIVKKAKMITIGADYTIGIGNGLHVLGEHMITALGEEVTEFEEDNQISAVSMNYPIGLFDNFQAMGYYSWEWEEYFQYYNWNRTYDTFTLNLSLFHYPEINQPLAEFSPTPFGSGYGAQLMVIYYH